MSALTEVLFGELADAIGPLVRAASSDGASGDGIRELARDVGYDIDAVLTPALAGQLSNDLGTAWTAITGIINDPNGFADKIPDLALAIADAITALESLNGIAGPGADLGRRLLDYAVSTAVEQRSPSLAALMAFFGIFLREKIDAVGTLDAYERREIRWDRIPKLLKPADLFRDVYGWNTAVLDSNRLLARFSELLVTFGAPAYYIGSSAAGTDGKLRLVWNLDFGAVTAQLELDGTVDATGTDPPGLVFVPRGMPAFQQDFPVGGGWKLTLALKADITSPYELSLRPPGKLRLQETGGGTPTWTFGGELGLAHVSTDIANAVIFGTANSTHFGARSIGVTIRGQMGSSGGEGGAEFAIAGGEVVVKATEADGFLQKVLPPDGLRTGFDFTLGWSTTKGVYVGGSAALEAVFPIHETLGPIAIESITVTIKLTTTGAIGVIGAVTGGLALGPVAASIDRVGVRAEIHPGPPLNLQVYFEPPKGLGLVVDASVVKGGGYLYFDFEKGEYAGVLELSIKDQIQVKAIGLLTTKLPDGKPGFSLLLIITAQFSPIQLGLGFTLTGIGGLAGINRTMLVEVLRAGLKNHTLGSIMFPENPVKNATKIISDLRSIFPPTEGRYVFGPMLELNWGTPALITAEIGVFIELPAPINLAILGIIKATLPDPDEAVVKIHMDIIGIVEFEKRRLSIDGTIYDSQIVGLALSGDLALRLLWGDRPNFALSVGGLNPRFAPPPEFPTLRRLQLSMGDGKNPRLSLDTYFAITSNTLQVGAHLDIRAEGGGFIVHGFLGFDALFIFSPFSFIAEMAGGVDLMRGSSVIMSIHLDFTLSGPAPWHAFGHASFKILFFTVSVGFDVLWGDPAPAALPDADAKQPLLAAFAEAGSWSAMLPAETERGASLADVKAPSGLLLVHPLGRLQVQQKVVPLGETITRFGSAKPKDWNHFAISTVTLNGHATVHSDVTDFFARGQFFELSDEQKLSKESFEKMASGATIGVDDITKGATSTLEVHYETFLVDDPILPSRPAARYKLDANTFMWQLRVGAGSLSPVRCTGELKFSQPGVVGKVQVADVMHVIVSTDDLSVRGDLLDADGTTQVSADSALDRHLAKNPEDRGRVQVMPKHEVAP